jgi:hypothetical protein
MSEIVLSLDFLAAFVTCLYLGMLLQKGFIRQENINEKRSLMNQRVCQRA